jgi:hypothetical protein
MACVEVETLLLEYAELAGSARVLVDAHVAQCLDCREFLDALRTVDSQLTAEYTGLPVPSSFAPAVRQRVQTASPPARPSLVPELLDFVGWEAITVLVGLLAWWLIPVLPAGKIDFSLDPWFGAGAFLLAALLVGVRSFADLRG